MQTLLTQMRNPGVRAYFVWGPFTQAANEGAARSAAQRYPVSNSVHFWTPNIKLGQELASVLRLAGGVVAWDVFLLYPKAAFWDLKPPLPIYWQHQLEMIQGEPYNLERFEGQIVQALRAR